MSEKYQGVKFNFALVNIKKLDDYRITKLKKWCEVFDKENLAPAYFGGSFGNLSFRLEKGKNIFIITGTQVGLKSKLDNEKFVKVLDCNLYTKEIFAEGTIKPSSESMLHYAIYKTRPDVNAIFHGHSADILNSVVKLNFTETLNEEPYGSIELVNSVLEILNDKTKFFIIKNHGFFAIESDMDRAGNLSIEMLQKSLKK